MVFCCGVKQSWQNLKLPALTCGKVVFNLFVNSGGATSQLELPYSKEILPQCTQLVNRFFKTTDCVYIKTYDIEQCKNIGFSLQDWYTTRGVFRLKKTLSTKNISLWQLKRKSIKSECLNSCAKQCFGENWFKLVKFSSKAAASKNCTIEYKKGK